MNDLSEKFYTERVVFVAKAETSEKILGYVTTFPGIWNNKSHFIRCAIENYINEQRHKGRHITKTQNEAIL